MGQTPEGARKAVKTQLKKYGKDHFKVIGAKGGKLSKGGSFSTMSKRKLRQLASEGGKARARKLKEDRNVRD